MPVSVWGYAVAQMVKALHYKPEGQWLNSFRSRFQSASNINEYQEDSAIVSDVSSTEYN
jgi:hypothetical protein